MTITATDTIFTHLASIGFSFHRAPRHLTARGLSPDTTTDEAP